MIANDTLVWAAFLTVSSLVLLAYLTVAGRRTRVDDRLEGLAEDLGSRPEPETVGRVARAALPTLGKPLIPKDAEERTRSCRPA